MISAERPSEAARCDAIGKTVTGPTGGAAPLELSSWECLDLVREQPVGRICINDLGYPLAFPINYRVLAATPLACRIVIRTAPDNTIGRYHGPASLEVDHIELGHGRAWSVIVRGTLQPLLGVPGEVDPKPFVSAGRSRWMVLDGTAISGRRFTAHPGRNEFHVDWSLEEAP